MSKFLHQLWDDLKYVWRSMCDTIQRSDKLGVGFSHAAYSSLLQDDVVAGQPKIFGAPNTSYPNFFGTTPDQYGRPAVYYVAHPDYDGSYVFANPQPVPLAKSILIAPAPDSAANVMVKQLRFLLSQAPMLDAPENLSRAAHSVTKFAYIHPKTFGKLTGSPSGAALQYDKVTSRPYFFVRPSSTKWVITTLMPEKVVIYTPNPMPGIENLLAG